MNFNLLPSPALFLELQQNSIEAISPPCSPCRFMVAFYPMAISAKKVVHGKAADQSNALEDISYNWQGKACILFTKVSIQEHRPFFSCQ